MQQTKLVSVPMYQWKTANSFVTLLQSDSVKLAQWCKNPKSDTTPNILLIISRWTQVFDLSESLTTTPVSIPKEKESALGQQRIYTLEYIKKSVIESAELMTGVEKRRPEEFQNILRDQMRDLCESFRQNFIKARFMDDDEFEEFYVQADTLEWLRMGINIIRLEYPRLKDIGYFAYEQKLSKLKGQFFDSVGGRSLPLPYSPQSFKWRKEEK